MSLPKGCCVSVNVFVKVHNFFVCSYILLGGFVFCLFLLSFVRLVLCLRLVREEMFAVWV